MRTALAYLSVFIACTVIATGLMAGLFPNSGLLVALTGGAMSTIGGFIIMSVSYAISNRKRSENIKRRKQ